jgi:hypothetical protein
MIPDEELDKRLLVLKIIWFAMLASLGAYLAVALVAAPTLPPSTDIAFMSALRTILFAVGVVILVATRHVRKLVLSGREQPASGAARIAGPPAIQRYATAMIVSLALSESIGIFGLVLFFLGRNPADLYFLLAVSAVAMTLYRPRKEEVLELMRERPGAL